MRRIETHRARVPWSWTVGMAFPWLAYYVIDITSQSGPLVFTMRKFVTHPTAIGLLSSLHVAFGFAIGVVVSYMSDRRWTSWGRRRPFLIFGWGGVALALFCLPFVSSLWTLVGAILALQISQAIAKPFEPLYNEVIPPPQRGRAATIRTLLQTLTVLAFSGALIAQYDHVYSLAAFGLPALRGETVFYWAAGALLAAITCFIAFGIRETPPPGGMTTEPFRLRKFVRDVFGDRQWWMIYMLYAVPSVAAAGVDNFGVLMRTDQLGFSKQQLAASSSIVMLVSAVVFVPITGFLTDRVSRLRLFQLGVVGPAVVNLVFYLWIRYLAHYTISFQTLVTFGIIDMAFRSCVWAVWGALMYDYVPANRLGTVSAGFSFVAGMIPFVMTNLAGLWVSGFTAAFGAVGRSPYDYSSICVLQALAAAVAFAMTWFFARAEKRGQIIPYGRLETRVTR